MKRIADDEVEDDDHDERERGKTPVGQSLRRFLRLVEDMLSIAFALGVERPLPIADPSPRDEEVENGADDAEYRPRPCGCAEEGGRDDVLDLRRAGDGNHAVGKNAHPEQSWQKFFRNVRLPEEDCRKRIHNERHHKYRESAIRQYTAADKDGKNRLVLPERLHDLIRDSGGKTALFHDLCKDCTEEKNGIVGLDVLCRLGHVDLAVDRHERMSAAEGGDDGEDRRDEDDGVAAVGEDHEQDETDEDHGEFHAILPFHLFIKEGCCKPLAAALMCRQYRRMSDMRLFLDVLACLNGILKRIRLRRILLCFDNIPSVIVRRIDNVKDRGKIHITISRDSEHSGAHTIQEAHFFRLDLLQNISTNILEMNVTDTRQILFQNGNVILTGTDKMSRVIKQPHERRIRHLHQAIDFLCGLNPRAHVMMVGHRKTNLLCNCTEFVQALGEQLPLLLRIVGLSVEHRDIQFSLHAVALLCNIAELCAHRLQELAVCNEVLLYLFIRLREEEGTEPCTGNAHAAQVKSLLQHGRILRILSSDLTSRKSGECHLTDTLLKGVFLAEIRHIVIGPRNGSNPQTNLCHRFSSVHFS